MMTEHSILENLTKFGAKNIFYCNMSQITKLFVKITCLVAAATNAAAYVPYPYYAYHAGQSSYPAAVSPTITSVSSNILRTPGNLGQISTYHKSIETPFSKVRKADVRISNDLVAPFAAAYHVAAPLQIPTTPVHALHTAPVAIAYSAAPTVAHLTFDGFGTHYAW